MKQLFKIDESEKRRILEMHEKATRKNYLNEQNPPPAEPSSRQPYVNENGVKYNLPAIQSNENLATFINSEQYSLYGNFERVPGYKVDLKNHISYYVIALLDLIAQKATNNQSICNKDASLGQLIDDTMMSRAFDGYKKRMEIFGLEPMDPGRFYQIASGFYGAKQNITTIEMNKKGKDNIRNGVSTLAQVNIKKIPNACQA